MPQGSNQQPPLDKIRLHFYGPARSGMLPPLPPLVSSNLQGRETVPRPGEAQIVLEDTPKPGIDWMLNRSTNTREPLKVLELRSQLINCTFIYGTIFGRSLLPTGLRALPSEYPRHLEQCLVCRKCLMNE